MPDEAIPPIKVWRFHDAPPYLRDLSDNGGDEDWLAEVPPGYGYIPWIEDGRCFGICDVSEYVHPHNPAWKVFIGCHA